MSSAAGPDEPLGVGGGWLTAEEAATETAEAVEWYRVHGTPAPTKDPTDVAATRVAEVNAIRTHAATRNELKLFPIVQVKAGLGTDVPTALPYTPPAMATLMPRPLTAAAARLVSATPAAGASGSAGAGRPMAAEHLLTRVLPLAALVRLGLVAVGLAWRRWGEGQDEWRRQQVSAAER